MNVLLYLFFEILNFLLKIFFKINNKCANWWYIDHFFILSESFEIDDVFQMWMNYTLGFTILNYISIQDYNSFLMNYK